MSNQQHRTADHGPWMWVSKNGHERALDAAGFKGLCVYFALCRMESDAPIHAKHCFHASVQNIAHRCGLSARTVDRVLPILERAGLFKKYSGKHAAASRSHEANKYTLLNVGVSSVRGTEAYDSETRIDGAHKRNFSRKGERSFKGKQKRDVSDIASPAEAGSDAEPRPNQDKIRHRECGDTFMRA